MLSSWAAWLQLPNWFQATVSLRKPLTCQNCLKDRDNKGANVTLWTCSPAAQGCSGLLQAAASSLLRGSPCEVLCLRCSRNVCEWRMTAAWESSVSVCTAPATLTCSSTGLPHAALPPGAGPKGQSLISLGCASLTLHLIHPVPAIGMQAQSLLCTGYSTQGQSGDLDQLSPLAIRL